uniref:chondroadherin n=1 Tax=Doryrhamphus excisus TaxID=161450 RepID=UPI0025ADF90F|nr:chondroadherin [Doryrhamphus excisus]
MFAGCVGVMKGQLADTLPPHRSFKVFFLPVNGDQCSAEGRPPGAGTPPTHLFPRAQPVSPLSLREDAMRRISWLLLGTFLMARGAPSQCPGPCHCHGDLQHVICDGVGLKKIPRVSESTRLLNLQRNALGGVPSGAFSESGGLVSLHMQHCQLRHVAAHAFKGLTKLVYLYLSHNHIASIQPSAFDDLAQLTYLHLDHNRIGELAKGIFSPLVNLFVLRLDDNKLRELRPGTFNGAKDLRWLHLSANELTTLQAGSLDAVENLAVLHLDHNKMATFPAAAMSKLRVVEELTLSRNPMRSIPDHAFQSFGRYMEKLHLDHMGLEKLSDGAFSGVTALTSLHINNNKLRSLPRSLDLSRVTNLTVSNNPWSCTCQLAPLRRWMDANRNRPDAVCASPSPQRGKQIRDSGAFAGCRVKLKKAKAGPRH